MRQILLISLFFSFNSFAATKSTPEIKKQYLDFKKSYTQMLTIANDKATFQKEFDSLHKSLKEKYDTFALTEKSKLTPEGNQMALDIEMLEPLEVLARGPITVDSCTDAQLINELNADSDAKTYASIKKSVETLCK